MKPSLGEIIIRGGIVYIVIRNASGVVENQ